MRVGGEHLFLGGSHCAVVCYDPRTDTWAGPVKVAGRGFEVLLASSGGLWGWSRPQAGDEPRLVCVSTASLLEAAAKAGLTWTSQQLKARREKLLAAAQPLNRAKFAIALRRFNEARRLLEEILNDTPDNAEAQLLMGFVHDTQCLGRPDEAMAWYQKVAALDEPEAALAAMVMQCWQHAAAGLWSEALAVTDAAMARFKLDYHATRDFQRMRRELAGKAPARKKSR